jgi:hypothetical protein
MSYTLPQVRRGSPERRGSYVQVLSLCPLGTSVFEALERRTSTARE